MLYDTHTHLYFDQISDQCEALLQAFEASGGRHLNCVAIDLLTSHTCISLAQKYPIISAVVGIHPTSAQDMGHDELWEQIHKLDTLIYQHRNHIVAIGEIGLDYHWLDRNSDIRNTQIQAQRYAFGLQAQLAKKYDLPCVIHSRDCASEIYQCIQEQGVQRFVMHCFSYDTVFVDQIFALSAQSMISFTGNITYPKSEMIRDVARHIPLNRIMIETDTPYLVPQSKRQTSSFNSPSNVRDVLSAIQSIRPEGPDTIETTIFENSGRFFHGDDHPLLKV